MKRAVMAVVAGFVATVGVLCCVPAQQNLTPYIEPKNYKLQESINDNDTLSEKNENLEMGTGWVAKLDKSWEIKRGNPGEVYEIYALKENYKGVKVALGSIMVIPYDECPLKFINTTAQIFINVTGATPVKDAVQDVNGQTWYMYLFTSNEGSKGIFAATVNDTHGYVIECVTASDDLEDTIEVCSDFVSSVALINKRDFVREIEEKEKKKKTTYVL